MTPPAYRLDEGCATCWLSDRAVSDHLTDWMYSYYLSVWFEARLGLGLGPLASLWLFISAHLDEPQLVHIIDQIYKAA